MELPGERLSEDRYCAIFFVSSRVSANVQVLTLSAPPIGCVKKQRSGVASTLPRKASIRVEWFFSDMVLRVVVVLWEQGVVVQASNSESIRFIWGIETSERLKASVGSYCWAWLMPRVKKRFSTHDSAPVQASRPTWIFPALFVSIECIDMNMYLKTEISNIHTYVRTWCRRSWQHLFTTSLIPTQVDFISHSVAY